MGNIEIILKESENMLKTELHLVQSYQTDFSLKTLP